MFRLIPAHAGKTWAWWLRARPPRAHPRSRGENPIFEATVSTSDGSSPLTRGKPPTPCFALAATGLIPAHAGKTAARRGRRSPMPAHPRSRGENWRSAISNILSSGSSPLTRGKRQSLCCRRPPGRLIPAHAGKTSPRKSYRDCRTAHPRSRGENHDCGDEGIGLQGSSPLTRGKPAQRPGRTRNARLIPAHAGKTPGCEITLGFDGAHPRSRGENRARRLVGANLSGSSPLTRGKPFRQVRTDEHNRLIPAHAGKTCHPQQPNRATPAHPRSRGENHSPGRHTGTTMGSSPLTRGKHGRRRRVGGRHRLIPAHAGKTLRSRRLEKLASAHPRSRGENTYAGEDRNLALGSSPLTRGKHFPTCAFTAQIDQILETLELAVSSGSYSVWVACATDAPQDQVRSIGLVLPSSRGAS